MAISVKNGMKEYRLRVIGEDGDLEVEIWAGSVDSLKRFEKRFGITIYEVRENDEIEGFLVWGKADYRALLESLRGTDTHHLERVSIPETDEKFDRCEACGFTRNKEFYGACPNCDKESV